MEDIRRSDDERYNVFMGLGGHKLIHWEHWSNPDAETYLTGIDYFDHPRLCRPAELAYR